MVTLQGDFQTMPLGDLVVYLGNRRATGKLTLHRGDTRKDVVLRDGNVIGAHSNLPREYLGQFFINLGQLTEDQFAKAYETQKETQISIGRILVMIGLVTEPQVQNALSLKYRETLLSAFEWPEGQFLFDTDTGVTSDEGEFSVSLAQISKEAALRDAAWRAIRAVFVSGRMTLRVNRANLPEPLRPGSQDSRLLDLAEQGLTVDELILALHATEFGFYQRLFAMHRLEVVQAVAPRASVAPVQMLGETSPPAQIAAHAKRFLQMGQLREAESLARQAHEQFASPEHAALVRQTEKALLTHLTQALLEGDKIASLAANRTALTAMELAAPERYLLSQVDGRRTIRAIVQASPLGPLEALKSMDNLISRKLLSLL
ncbi:MAG: DUF4388 domain-containing protein [Myxococcaceae bacterium]